MAVDPQSQSLFLTQLPWTIRDIIYRELWRSYGARQHVVWHNDRKDQTKSHFCRWTCNCVYHVEDDLQLELEALRLKRNIQVSEPIRDKNYACRLLSPWLNHWTCGEQAEAIYGEDAIRGSSTWGECWKKNTPRGSSHFTPSPYLPMLQSCKVISLECLESMYSYVTFVFTDPMSFQVFVGCCEWPPMTKDWLKMPVQPPAFPKHVRRLELSTNPLLPLQITCSTPYLTAHPNNLHDAYDFHWLKLELFEKLQSIKIWVAARSTMWFPKPDGRDVTCVMVTDLDFDALKRAATIFDHLDEFILSTPLKRDVAPEETFVKDISQNPGCRVWSRGTGDSFRLSSAPSPLFAREHVHGSLVLGRTREIQLAISPTIPGLESEPPPQPYIGQSVLNGHVKRKICCTVL